MESPKRPLRRKLLILLAILVGLTVLAAAALYFFVIREDIANLSKVERIAYSEKLSFEPFDLQDLHGTEEGDAIVSALEDDRKEVTIPANSRITVRLSSFCLNKGFSPPDSERPVVFSYEKLDMPLFAEITAYKFEHELDQRVQDTLQDLTWNLSSDGQLKFDELTFDEQEFLLKVSPDAKSIVDSYEYYRNLSVKFFDFGEELAEWVVPQRVPGTELYAKILDTSGWESVDLEIYNPTSAPQNFPVVTEGGVLTIVPAGWSKPIELEIGDFYRYFKLTAGKLDVDIAGRYIQTPSDIGAFLISDYGGMVILDPSTKISFDQLDESFQKSEEWEPEDESGGFPRIARADVENMPVIVQPPIIEYRNGGTIIVTRYSDGTVVEYHVPSGRSKTYKDCRVIKCGTTLPLILGNAWAKVAKVTEEAFLSEEEIQALNVVTGNTGGGVRGLIPENLADLR